MGDEEDGCADSDSIEGMNAVYSVGILAYASSDPVAAISVVLSRPV